MGGGWVGRVWGRGAGGCSFHSPAPPPRRQCQPPSRPAVPHSRHCWGKLGRCMTQVTREHRSGARRLFKNSSPNVSGRREGSSGRGGSAAVFRLLDGPGQNLFETSGNNCGSLASLTTVHTLIHPTTTVNTMKTVIMTRMCVALPETKLVHDGN